VCRKLQAVQSAIGDKYVSTALSTTWDAVVIRLSVRFPDFWEEVEAAHVIASDE
jgi:hypothetical protein